jgi:kinetochore protein Mis13/DSN1
MTALFARQPLHPLSMSSSQRAPRRLSARLQEKEDVHPQTNGFYPTSSKTATTQKSNEENASMSKKRKIGKLFQHMTCPAASIASDIWLTRLAQDYDEEDDGFLFTRAKTCKVRASACNAAHVSAPVVTEPQPISRDEPILADGDGDVTERAKGRKRNKMSFSTPNIREEKPARRSKRLSDEDDQREGSPQRRARRKEATGQAPAGTIHQQIDDQPPAREKTPNVTSDVIVGEEHSATRIALPFADTPVIRRNKAMREGKGGKGERRSSLGLRGRRASSLIDSGNSNGK